MSWLKEIVRPKILTRSKRDVNASMWKKCTECGEMLYGKDLQENLHVCMKCNHHLRMPLDERFEYLFDADSIEDISVKAPALDPLKFKDRKKYTDRLKDAHKTANGDDAFRVVRAKIKKQPVITCAFDFDFMAGSMGSYVGEAIVIAAETAAKEQLPLLLIPASGGARMQEGILSLMQMARSTAAIQKVKEQSLPYLVLLTDPTTGGVTASFAMQGDVTLAEPGALIGFAGPRVIQQTIGETLPEGFQRAEYLYEHGMVDVVAKRQEQAGTIANLLKLLSPKN